MLSFTGSLSPDSDALAIFVTENYEYKDKRHVLSKDVEKKIVFMYEENSFQQSIEYAGRDGDNLEFIY